MFNEISVIAILNGCPGSGKSTLVKKIISEAETNSLSYKVCSADNYWLDGNGNYNFDINKLKLAHEFCKNEFDEAVKNNINWIIVDNTNVTLSAIKPYYNPDNRYNYKLVRPNTDWYFNAEECFKRNIHNVPLNTIEKMINNIKKLSLEDMRIDICWI